MVSSAVNRSCLFFRALSRTPFNPCDIRTPLCVGWVLGSMLFSLVRDLLSATSASRVSTGLVRLLRRYYVSVRLLARVPARIVLLASRAGPGTGWSRMPARSLGSRACSFSTCSWLSDYAGSAGRTRAIVLLSLAFPLGAHGRHPDCVFRSSIPGPSMPLSTLHPATHVTQRKTRGQDGSLLLSCGALSSPTARRFIPTIALPDGRASESFHALISVAACLELRCAGHSAPASRQRRRIRLRGTSPSMRLMDTRLRRASSAAL